MLQCSFLLIIQEIIIFMTYCKLVIGNYKGLYLACIMQIYGCPLLYGAFLATYVCSLVCRPCDHGPMALSKITHTPRGS